MHMRGTSGHSCPNETGLNFFIFFLSVVSSTHPFYACVRVGPLIPVILARRRWRKRRETRGRLFVEAPGEHRWPGKMTSVSNRPAAGDASMANRLAGWPRPSGPLGMSRRTVPSSARSLPDEWHSVSSTFFLHIGDLLLPRYSLQKDKEILPRCGIRGTKQQKELR